LQAISFLSDGGDNVRDLQLYLSPLAEHLLDWFHVTMRITVLRQQLKELIVAAPDHDLATLDSALERVKRRAGVADDFITVGATMVLHSGIPMAQGAARMDSRIVIVGGGAAGLSAAGALKRRGRDARVLDRNARVGDVWA